MADELENLVPRETARKIDEFFARGLERRRTQETEELRGMFGSIALARFREGLTDEDLFIEELRMLGYPEDQIERYLAGGRLAYALDYVRDLMAAWRDAVRKGNMSIDAYGEKLSEIGIVPERVAAYMLREVARLKPEDRLTPVGPPKPFYETDAGKIVVDTSRRRRRKLLISRDEEIAALLETGMPIEMATAIADNDDVRLAEKGGEE